MQVLTTKNTFFANLIPKIGCLKWFKQEICITHETKNDAFFQIYTYFDNKKFDFRAQFNYQKP